MPDSSNSPEDTSKVSRRGALKWTGAIAGAAVIGIVAGVGGDLLARPNSTTTSTVTNLSTQTATATKTATAMMTETETATQVQSVTQTVATTQAAQTVVQTTTATATQTMTQQSTTVNNFPGQEVLLVGAHDSGPFVAHNVDGVWTRSDPLVPNLPVGQNVFAVRNRVYSPDRIRYPMKRVNWAPGGKSDNSTRGQGQFVRISWNEAINSTATEIARIIKNYGPSALYSKVGGHQWTGALHKAAWIGNLFSLLGGYTTRIGGTSTVGWQDGSPLIWGNSTYPSNNTADLIANCKLLIFWSTDPVRTSIYAGTGATTNLSLVAIRKAGIKTIVIDSRFNDTAALMDAQWIPITPGTDNALLAAIAYLWITNGTYSKTYVSSHSIGFDQSTMPAGAAPNSSFSDYILGTGYDKVPKTPQWASPICGVSVATITSLATAWASAPTYVDCQNAGANRAEWAGEWTRMMVALGTMQGSLGLPGQGIGGDPGPLNSSSGMTGPAATPSVTNPVTQRIHHLQFGDAVLNPPITWTSGAMIISGTSLTYGGKGAVPVQWTYPMKGYSPIQMVYDVGGSAANQMEGPDNYHKAWQSQNLQFIASQHTWWEDMQIYCDIVMPTNHIGEREDITTFQNYLVHMSQIIQPLFESKTDFEVAQLLSQAIDAILGTTTNTQLFQGLSMAQWLAKLYAGSNCPLSWPQFQAQGYYAYPMAAVPAAPSSTLAAFSSDPVKNPLTTPSGLIEFYSPRIVSFWGANNATAPAVPMYMPATENMNSTLAKKYPLLHTGGAQKFGRHSQWDNLSWLRDEMQTFLNGYRTITMNTADATSRGLKDGDVVRVFNDRGQTLCAVRSSSRMTSGVVWIFEGGQIKQQQPGVAGSLDMGGDNAMVAVTFQAEPICDGIAVHSGLVQVEKYTG